MSTVSKISIIVVSIFILNFNYEAKANIFSSAVPKIVNKLFTKGSKNVALPAGIAAKKALEKDNKDKDKNKKNR